MLAECGFKDNRNILENLTYSVERDPAVLKLLLVLSLGGSSVSQLGTLEHRAAAAAATWQG